MFAGLDRESRLPDLQDRLRRAQGVTPDLMSKVVAGAGTRFTMPGCAGKAARIDRFIASEAWTEAALALVELEFPQWRLHRPGDEGGTWFFSLAPRGKLPALVRDFSRTRPPD